MKRVFRLVFLNIFVVLFVCCSFAIAQANEPSYLCERHLSLTYPVYSVLTPNMKKIWNQQVENSPKSITDFWIWFKENSEALYTAKCSNESKVKELTQKIATIDPDLRADLGWSNIEIKNSDSNPGLGGAIVRSKEKIRTLQISTRVCNQNTCRLAQQTVLCSIEENSQTTTHDMEAVQLGSKWLVKLGPHSREVDEKRLIPCKIVGIYTDVNSKRRTASKDNQDRKILFVLNKNPVSSRLDLKVYSNQVPCNDIICLIARCLGAYNASKILGNVDFEDYDNAPGNSVDIGHFYSKFQNLKKTTEIPNKNSSEDLSPCYPLWKYMCPYTINPDPLQVALDKQSREENDELRR